MRILFFSFLFLIATTARGQLFLSDQGTPLIPPVPCDCDKWSTIVKQVDSTVNKLHEVLFEKNGQKYKRSYYVTIYDSSLYDICDLPANCTGARRNRQVPGERDWFVDTALCKFISFKLPCCSDKKINVKDIAKVTFNGKCDIKYSPETISLPQLTATSLETVTATASDGTSLTASIEMVNQEIKITGKADPILEKLKKINEIGNTKFKPVLDKGNALLNKYLGLIGNWESEFKLNFSFGGEASKICCPTDPKECVKNSYKVFGEAEAGITGKVGIPVTGLPVIGKYLGGVEVVVTLGVAIGLNVNAKTTCDNFAVCVSPEGKVTGGGGFAFTVAGFKAEGQVLVEGGGLSGEVCLLPEFEVKCIQLNTGKLKLVGSVEDKWGWVKMNVEYVVWGGFSMPLKGCD